MYTVLLIVPLYFVHVCTYVCIHIYITPLVTQYMCYVVYYVYNTFNYWLDIHIYIPIIILTPLILQTKCDYVYSVCSVITLLHDVQ